MDPDNPVFTGFLDNDQRIDLVLVMAPGGNLETTMRINYLTNIVRFGLELELVEGKMSEHKNLTFIKLHAPDSVIEEYGIYFNVRKFFKDAHVDYIKSGKHEKDAIKVLREQYPGPINYSTLERSEIVYNIILRLPFGKNEHIFGMNQLLNHNIIIDAYALHDGPYFLVSGQETCVNARQTLFYNWVGLVNVCKNQPLHLIQEYLGDGVAMYFAYYEYFNFTLMFPAILGVALILVHVTWPQTELDYRSRRACEYDEYRNHYFCPLCRHYDICTYRRRSTYCRELEFLRLIDTDYMQRFGYLVSLWGIVFFVLWKRKQNYLAWMWETKDKYMKSVFLPGYWGMLGIRREFQRSHLTGVSLDDNFVATLRWSLVNLLWAVLFSLWLLVFFTLSIQIWYVKYWLDSKFNDDPFGADRLHEHLYIGIGATVYSFVTIPLKIIAKIMVHKLAALENNQTIGSYNSSLALKLYGFYFTGTFALLTLHTIVGNIFYTHHFDEDNWYSFGGFKVMNNGLGTSLDDMCITLAVAIVIEQIFVKIPSYINRKSSDYQYFCDDIVSNTPIWEREYKLENLNDEFFHNEYNDLAIKFGMATLFSMAFPLAPLFILIINIWDIRHKARTLLLAHRRPILLKISGPGIWDRIILITSFVVPVYIVCIIAFQSRNFLMNRVWPGVHNRPYVTQHNQYFDMRIKQFNLDFFEGHSKEWKKHPDRWRAQEDCFNLIYHHWSYNDSAWQDRPHHKRTLFVPTYEHLHVVFYKHQYIIVYVIVNGAGYLKRADTDRLYEIFLKYATLEKNGEKHISSEDFVRKFLGLFGEDDYNKESVQLIAGIVDMDKDGYISFSEFQAFEGLLCVPDALYKTAFQLFDTNGNGLVAFDEFAEVMQKTALNKKLPFNMESTFVRLYFGKDKKRLVTYPEFSQFLHDFHEEYGVEAFKKCDKDGSGFITAADFRDIMLSIKNHLLTKELKTKVIMEVNRRIQLGWAAFGLRDIFSSKIRQCLKTKVFEQCVLPVMTYGSETWSLTMGLIRRLRVTQRTTERAKLGISRRDQIRNVEICRRTSSYRHSSTSREAEVAMGRAYSSEKGWTLGSQGAGMSALVSAALVDPQRG
ncbi:jg16210 [Pararge aegeria aegeria]|uniref:Anoctamin n=1 Tax=Pararge aegeria aegeria TaxID=348720 RepID=A0A8S4RW24_9NEOP|nr:jg16210 [Pararge aegeria aegeria]